jgi:hypothetical protein
MKTGILFLLAGFVGGSLARAEEAVPTAPSPDRYSRLSQHCPFAVASAVAPAMTTGSFAANWFISGIGRMGDVDFVSIKARDLSTQFSLFGQEPKDGVVLVEVNWSNVVGKSTVTLRKGSEVARLAFNEAIVHASPTTEVADASAKDPASALGVVLPRTTSLQRPFAPTASAAQDAAPVTVRRRIRPIAAAPAP